MRFLLYIASLVLSATVSAHAQLTPFGPTIAPPAGVFGPPAALFAPTVRPLVPSAYNNQYYNPALTADVPILTYSNDQNIDGSYAFSFSTADGKQAQESGYLKDAYVNAAGEPEGVNVVQGSFAYTAPDGTPIQVTYTADENGFHPQGVHIPADGRYAPPPPGTPNAVAARYDPYNRYGSQLNRYNNQYDRYNNQYDRYNNQYDRYNNQYDRYNNQYDRYNNQNDRYNYNPLGQYNQYDRYNRYNTRYPSTGGGKLTGAAPGTAGAATRAVGVEATPPAGSGGKSN